MPYTPGSEVAGTISAVGDGVLDRSVGERVLALPSSGGYASQVVVPSPAAVPIPDNLTSGQAAGLVQSYATMLYALTRRTTVGEGEWFAVLGAGGGIGLAAVDLATALGAQVVACASTAAKLELASAVGRGGDDRLRGRRHRPQVGDPRGDRRRRRLHRRPDRRAPRPSRRCAACAGRVATW